MINDLAINDFNGVYRSKTLQNEIEKNKNWEKNLTYITTKLQVLHKNIIELAKNFL